MLLFFKKAAFVLHPDSGAACWFCLKDRCSVSNNSVLVQRDFGVKTPLNSSLRKNLLVFLITTSIRRFELANRKMACCSETAHLTTQEAIKKSVSSTRWSRQLFGCAVYSTTLTQAAPGGILEAIVPWHRYYWMSNRKTKTIHFESSFHFLLSKNTN